MFEEKMDNNIQKKDRQDYEPVIELNIINGNNSEIDSMSYIGSDQTSYSDIAYSVEPVDTENNCKANEWLQQVLQSTDSTDDERDEFIKNGTIHLRGLSDELNKTINSNVKQYTDRIIDIGNVGLGLKELNKGSNTLWSKFSKKKITFLKKRVLQRAMKLAKRSDCHDITCLGVDTLDKLCTCSDDIPKLLADHGIQYGEDSKISMREFRKAVKAIISSARLKKEGFDFPFEDVASAVNCALKVDKPLIDMLKAAQENNKDPLTLFQTISARMSPSKMKQLYYKTISSLEQDETEMYQGLIEESEQDEEPEDDDDTDTDTDTDTETNLDADELEDPVVEDVDTDPGDGTSDGDTQGDVGTPPESDNEDQELNQNESGDEDNDLDSDEINEPGAGEDEFETDPGHDEDPETDDNVDTIDDEDDPEIVGDSNDTETNEDTDPETNPENDENQDTDDNLVTDDDESTLIETGESEDEEELEFEDDDTEDVEKTESGEDVIVVNDTENDDLEVINDPDILKSMVAQLRKENKGQDDEIVDLKQQVEKLEIDNLYLKKQLQAHAAVGTGVAASLKTDSIDEEHAYSMA